MLKHLRPMFERLAYVIWLGLTGLSIGFAGLSPWFHWPTPGLFALLGGLGGLMLSLGLRFVGRGRLHFAEHEHAFDVAAATGFLRASPEHEARVSNLRRVFYEWDALEVRRERGDADIWQVHALRQQAQTLLQADPQLRTEFDHELARHPELGER